MLVIFVYSRYEGVDSINCCLLDFTIEVRWEQRKVFSFSLESFSIDVSIGQVRTCTYVQVQIPSFLTRDSGYIFIPTQTSQSLSTISLYSRRWTYNYSSVKSGMTGWVLLLGKPDQRRGLKQRSLPHDCQLQKPYLQLFMNLYMYSILDSINLNNNKRDTAWK